MPPTTTAVQPVQTLLAAYQPPPYLADTVQLVFELHEDHARVTASTRYAKNPASDEVELVLHGEQLQLLSLRLDDTELVAGDYAIRDGRLRLTPLTPQFTLTAVTRITPQDNRSLEGLYRSGGMFCTQMEAEGFRRVTWFQDRPDVLATYTTTIIADKARYPVLLSNGNLVESGDRDDGRHFASWHDPHKKPCYLFALVAGDLARIDDAFTTRSGRRVDLTLFVDKGNEGKTAHAMESLKKSMRWDEQAFGREYDLDVFMTVAVSDFNLGAMENKGLNLFNDQVILANPQTATDRDFQRIEGVVGHEYFHNWSGNRVTCRDWFQLSLKEGFTVFRDQLFSAAMGHPAVQRISDVIDLRERQFPEDAGPLSHPVRPASYIAINNFYTATIYQKGAEVLRMLATLLGEQAFRAGSDLYFERHDGQAVRTEDFVAALADASGRDLSAFQRWYDQAGTPRLLARGRYDEHARTYELQLEQRCDATPGQPTKQPFPIPVRLGLVGPDGGDLPLRLDGEAAASDGTRVLLLDAASASFRFVDVAAPPVPSLLRGFSAPVRLELEQSDGELAFLACHDSDLFNRWEAGQRLASRVFLTQVASGGPADLPPELVDTFGAVLTDDELPPAFRALALALPEESVLGDLQDVVDVDGLHAVREAAATALARTHADALRATYERLARADEPTDGPWCVEHAGRRALKNVCLAYLARLGEAGRKRAVDQLASATTMTDELAALEVLAGSDNPHRAGALEHFRARWAHDALVMNKWFAVQAASPRAGVVDDVQRLAGHAAFDRHNPNKVRALYRTFAANQLRFHGADGRGYALLVDVVLELDRDNPILAARLAAVLNGWKRHERGRAGLMRAQLERVLASEPLSDNLYEVASKALA